jgi:septal ring factor EnvC (AmiA/AmiB activator)
MDRETLTKISVIENDIHRLHNENDSLRRYIEKLERDMNIINGNQSRMYYVVEKLLNMLSNQQSLSNDDSYELNNLINCL